MTAPIRRFRDDLDEIAECDACERWEDFASTSPCPVHWFGWHRHPGRRP